MSGPLPSFNKLVTAPFLVLIGLAVLLIGLVVSTPSVVPVLAEALPVPPTAAARNPTTTPAAGRAANSVPALELPVVVNADANTKVASLSATDGEARSKEIFRQLRQASAARASKAAVDTQRTADDVVSSAAAAFGSGSRSFTLDADSSVLPDEERMLLLAFEALAGARLDTAERHLRVLLEQYPDFHLARLALADVLMARSGRFVDFASGAAGKRVETLREEALVRLANARNVDMQALQPDALLQLSKSQRRAVVVDLKASRMYLYENRDGVPHLQRSFYVSIGKNGAAKRREGDQRTPVGVYFVTGRIAGGALPDFFGPGALPVNYPNEWDMRERRTGYGIWIHGVPSDTFSRAPRASDGCMALSNEHVALLLNLPQSKDTPVVIADGLNWRKTSQVKAQRREFKNVLDTWVADWQSIDVERYAAHYSENFQSEGGDRSAWLAHKRRVNAAKTFIKVTLDDVSLFAYPGERDTVVVTFEQKYSSSNYSNASRKRQYWQREADGIWRVVYEGPVKLRSEHLRGIPYSARAQVSSR